MKKKFLSLLNFSFSRSSKYVYIPKKETKMTKSKNILLLIALLFTISQQSFASLPEIEKQGPEIIPHLLTGAGEFAKLTEEYLQDISQNTIILTDVHGVVTNYSEPNQQPYDWDTKKTRYESRGDMVPYLKNLMARKYVILFSSAWPNPEETFTCLSELDLLSQEMAVQKGSHAVKTIRKYPPVTDQEFNEAAKDKTLLAILENRPSEETITTPYDFIQKGNCISVNSDWGYYRSKALVPDVYFERNSSSSPIDTLIFMEDSELNIRIFMNQLSLTTYYPTLKKVIIFKFPKIQGEVRDEDNIDPALL